MSKKGAHKSGSKKIPSNGNPAPTPKQRIAVPSAMAERFAAALPGNWKGNSA